MAEVKLWTVDVELEFQMAVMATSHAEAAKLARRHVLEEADHSVAADYHLTLSEGYAFDDSSIDGSLPYGGDGDETVAEVKERLGLESPFVGQMRRLRELSAKAKLGDER